LQPNVEVKHPLLCPSKLKKLSLYPRLLPLRKLHPKRKSPLRRKILETSGLLKISLTIPSHLREMISHINIRLRSSPAKTLCLTSMEK
jgi:hypothetical protein